MEEDDSFLEEATPEALIKSVKLAGAFDKLREVLAKELENSGVAAILRERTKEFLVEGGRIATTAARVGGPGKNPTHAAIRTDLLKQVEREKIPEQLQQDLGKALENIHEQMKESITQALNRCKEEWRCREASETLGESLTVSATTTNDPPPPPSISTKKEVPATKTQDTLAKTKSTQPGTRPGLTQRKSTTAAATVQSKNPPSVSSVSAQSSRGKPTVGAAPTTGKPLAHDVGKNNKENAMAARPAPANGPLPAKIKEERVGEEEEKSRQKEIPTPTQPSSAVALPRGQPAAGTNRRPKKKISSSDSSDSSSSDDSLSDSELSSMSDSSDSLSDSGSLSDSDSRDSSSEKKTTKGKGTATKGGRGTKRKQDQSSTRKGSSKGTKESSKTTPNGGRAQGQTKKRKLAEVSHIKVEKDAAAEPAASKRRRSEKVEKSGAARSRTKRLKNGIHAGGQEEEEEEKDGKDGTSHCKKPKEHNGEDKEGDIVNKQNGGGYGEGTHGFMENGEASGDTVEENKFNNGDHLTDSGRRKLRSSLSSRRKRRKVSEVNGSETPTSATESPTTNE